MALHSLYCADVPLRNCSLTHSHTKGNGELKGKSTAKTSNKSSLTLNSQNVYQNQKESLFTQP